MSVTKVPASLSYGARLVRLGLSNPLEFTDRLRGQWEVRQERGRSEVPPLTPGGWEAELHRLLGAETPCEACGQFGQLWSELCAELKSTTSHAAGEWYDAGQRLAQASFIAVRHLQPTSVVETGVARGLTSRFLLQGLEDHGELYSIDLPPNRQGWHNEAGMAVPLPLRAQWHYLRGASRRLLPPLVEQLAPLRLFIHDSLHTTKNVRFELDTVWPRLERGGLVLVDDVDQNSAFVQFCRRVSTEADWITTAEGRGNGMVGAILKR